MLPSARLADGTGRQPCLLPSPLLLLGLAGWWAEHVTMFTAELRSRSQRRSGSYSARCVRSWESVLWVLLVIITYCNFQWNLSLINTFVTLELRRLQRLCGDENERWVWNHL